MSCEFLHEPVKLMLFITSQSCENAPDLIRMLPQNSRDQPAACPCEGNLLRTLIAARLDSGHESESFDAVEKG
ncbi:MAG TPA: hypothetical protein VMV81_07410 [Phycisphaerae bacterium]|nr:hypothetical protein [Phycisphaerae bacterium]